MSVELTMLAFSVALLFVLVIIQANAGVMAQGLVPLANSRDGLPPPSGFHARMKRVVDNHREGLTIFAPLVLIAAVQGLSTPTTVLDRRHGDPIIGHRSAGSVSESVRGWRTICRRG